MKHLHNKYAIYRILGNEMPPRDVPNSRLKTLEYILSNEPDFENCEKFWIINCVHDENLKNNFIKILEEKNQKYLIVDFIKKKYLQSKTRQEKIVHAISINRTRNIAIKHGHKIAEFSFVLDGDCYFNEKLWKQVCFEIESDQAANNRKYYSIPTYRSRLEETKISIKPKLLTEPMLVFRYDSDLYFDENLEFGNQDKVELLHRLGHDPKDLCNTIDSSLSKPIGMVLHVTSSDFQIEENIHLRLSLRKQSITNLLNYIDNNSLKVAILIPICSRNRNYTIDSFPLLNVFLKTFDFPGNFVYKIFLGSDDNDIFFTQKEVQNKIKSLYKNISIHFFKDTNHNPVKAWNYLAEIAYNENYDYFYQIGDDVTIITRNSIEYFVKELKEMNNIGVVGPIDLTRPKLLTQSFVHRNHYSFFNFYYPTELENWYCDDWIQEVYLPHNSKILKGVIVGNSKQAPRYIISNKKNLYKSLVEKYKCKIIY